MIYNIPCSWEEYATVQVEADSLEEAIKIVEDENTPLPESDYVHGTFEIDYNIIYEINGIEEI